MSSPNNWVDYLDTPPNMFSGPFNNYQENMSSLLKPPPLSINESDFEEIFPSQPQPKFISNVPASTQMQVSPFQSNESIEIENRVILIKGLDASTQLIEIHQYFGRFGDISLVQQSESDFTVEYYDIRAASTAKMMMNGTFINQRKIDVSYALLPIIEDPKHPPNNGTIVIFHLPAGTTNQHINTVFGQFGEIRQIRGTPSKQTQRFVEFWDVRAAQRALVSMNGSFVMGSKVSIEFSLPGGFRRGIQKVNSSSPGKQEKMDLK